MGCGKPNCGGAAVPPVNLEQIRTALPTVEPDQTLFIQWVGETVGTKRIIGVTGRNYRFTASPRSQKLKPVVEGDPVGNEVNVLDAAEFVRVIRHNQQQFQWVIRENEKTTAPSPLDLSDFTVNSFKEALEYVLADVDPKALIAAEKAGKNRKGILALLEEE